jgi:hypothetical protein
VNIQKTISNAHLHGAHRPFGDAHMPAQTLPKIAITDLEINKRLALKIGWKSEQINEVRDGVITITHGQPEYSWPYREFSYCDTGVIRPIAERYNIWPTKIMGGYSKGKWMAFGQEHCVTADTAAMAVAMAVIGEAS